MSILDQFNIGYPPRDIDRILAQLDMVTSKEYTHDIMLDHMGDIWDDYESDLSH